MSKKGQSDLSGWKNLKKLLTQLDKTQIETGFFPESKYGDDNDNLQVAQVAAWQEWGTPYEVGTHIPPRPFMRVDFKHKMKSPDMRKHIVTSTNEILNGQAVRQALLPLAKQCQDVMVEAIDERDDPRNADSTVRLKGFDDPLNEYGDMVDAVKAKITKG